MFKTMFAMHSVKSAAFGACAMTLAVALCAPLLASADEAPAAKTPQQEKMTACNKEAGDKALKGDDRKKFMSECLSKNGTKVSQQEKMKICNKEAKDKELKGDDRKKFMSDCLKTSSKP